MDGDAGGGVTALLCGGGPIKGGGRSGGRAASGIAGVAIVVFEGRGRSRIHRREISQRRRSKGQALRTGCRAFPALAVTRSTAQVGQAEAKM